MNTIYLGLSDTDGLHLWIPITLSFFYINKYNVQLKRNEIISVKSRLRFCVIDAEYSNSDAK